MSVEPIALQPPAKLNLTLEVLGRRPDGYHELASVYQAINLCDELLISPSADLRLECSPPDLTGEGNLVFRAARLLRTEARVAAGAALRLTKSIPIAAGLGGGSSDAAATLAGLAQLWELDWPVERLAELAARLGSDVPFFLGSPTALAAGRGERLTPLPALPPYVALIVRPALRQPLPPDKTRRLYATLQPEDYRDGSATRRLVAAITAGHSIEPALLVNSFERPARELFPEVAAAERALLAAGASWVHLAGSGPCLYTLFADGETGHRQALAVAERLRVTGAEAYVVETIAAHAEAPS